MARAAFGLMQSPPRPQPTPKLSGCRVTAGSIVVTFDAALLGGEAVTLQPPGPGLVPFEAYVGPADAQNTGWVYAAALRVVNATSIAVDLPANVTTTPTALRYMWGNYPCCPGLDRSASFCPPGLCAPIVTQTTKEPAVPFWAHVEGGKCRCDAPWTCDA